MGVKTKLVQFTLLRNRVRAFGERTQEKGEEEKQDSPRTIDFGCGFAKELTLQGMWVFNSIGFVHPHAKHVYFSEMHPKRVWKLMFLIDILEFECRSWIRMNLGVSEIFTLSFRVVLS